MYMEGVVTMIKANSPGVYLHYIMKISSRQSSIEDKVLGVVTKIASLFLLLLSLLVVKT